MDELNFFPFYYELFKKYTEKENGSYNIPDEDYTPFAEWQQEYELINVSHQLEYGW